MLPILSAAAASLLTLPVLHTGTFRPTFTPQWNEGGAAAVQVRLVVSPTGPPVHCSTRFGNGPKTNGNAMCSMLQTSTRYAPARDSRGEPTTGVIYVWSHWDHRKWRSNAIPSWDPVDLILHSNRMPEGFRDGSLFRLIVQADAAGKIGSCAVSTAPLKQQVVDVLCREASAVVITPGTDDRGAAVPSVQEFTIRLTRQKTIDKLAKQLRSIQQ